MRVLVLLWSVPRVSIAYLVRWVLFEGLRITAIGTTTGPPVVKNVGGRRGSRAQSADNICSTERGCGKRVGRGSRRKREQPGQWWRHW